MSDSTTVAQTDDNGSSTPSTPASGSNVQGGVDAVNNFANKLDAWLGPQSDKLAGYISQALGAAGGAQAAASQVGAAAQQQAAGKIAVDTANEMAAIKQQNDDGFAAAQVGMTPGAPSALTVQLTDAIKDSAQKALAKNAQIQQMQGVSFWDDPMEWIVNQVAIPYEQDSLQSAVNEGTIAAQNLKDLGAQFNQQAKVDALVDTGASATRLAGMAQMTLGAAAQTAAEAKMRVASIGLDAVNVAARLSQEQFTNAIAANGQQMDGVRLQLQANSDARSEAMMPYQQALKDAQIQSKQDTNDGRIAAVNTANMVLKNFSMAPITSFQQLAQMPKQMKDFIASNATNENMAAFGAFSSTPANALGVLGQASGLGIAIPPGVKNTVGKLQQIAAATLANNDKAAQTTPGALTSRAMNPQQRSAKIDEGIQSSLQQEAQNIPVTGGIYSPPSLAQTLSLTGGSQFPALADYFKVTGIIDKSNPGGSTIPTDPSLLAYGALQLIRSGKATPEQMGQEISNVYSAAAIQNNNIRGYSKLSMPFPAPGDPKSAFNMSVPAPNGNDRPLILNMFNQAAVTAYLYRLSAPQPSGLSLFQQGAAVAGGMPNVDTTLPPRNPFQQLLQMFPQLTNSAKGQ